QVDVGEAALQLGARGGNKLAHGVDLARGRLKDEPELLGAGHEASGAGRNARFALRRSLFAIRQNGITGVLPRQATGTCPSRISLRLYFRPAGEARRQDPGEERKANGEQRLYRVRFTKYSTSDRTMLTTMQVTMGK